ncbi:MAG TPA: hypothetical protein PLP50_13225 [Thermoanaerobaculia bacterium]|jgi:hypothetical protein|nr:hypothetical protein [Thermoanaerobaculia bacterium]HPA52553.1 hypothetical protein [Thermoanaerobaculia bacterium]
MSSSASPRSAATILPRLDASAEAKALLTPDAQPSDYVALLVEKELFTDAAGFVAQWLEPYDAVAWACEAARAALGEAPPAERAALEAAERWLATRDEKDRRAAAEAAERLGHRSAPAMAAAAAGWTGGSLSSADLPAVAPPPGLAGKGASAAVLLAASSAAPEVPERLRGLIWRGVDLAEGRRKTGRGPADQARTGREG